MTMRTAPGWLLAAAVIGMILASPVAARDAAFMEPTSGAGGAGDEAIRAEPKGEIDIGETNVNMARRVTLFFANSGNVPVNVEKVNANSDANVIAEIANDDCSKQGTIAPDSRCTVELSITPTSPGTWSVEVLMTHNGAGRIARAKVSGKTSGTVASGDRKETGLDMSSKEVTPINFGDLEINGKAVRSALMVNDSPDPITILSIDVIEATNGLSLLDQGCSVDLELKPGETCPVTLVWAPSDAGQVSTDLIIRHSGRQGFTVIPVRGKTKGLGLEATTTGDKSAKPTDNKSAGGKNSGTPSLDAIQKAANLPQVPSDALTPPKTAAAPAAGTADAIRLIGTVGNKALLLLGDGSTKIVITGDDVDLDNDQKVKVTEVTAKSVGLLIDGKKKELKLGSAKELISKASASGAKSDKGDKKSGSSTNVDSSALSSTSTSTSSTSALPASTGTNPNVKQ